MMFHSLLARFRSDRGEGDIISTVVGSIMFMFAAVTIGTMVIMTTNASALAQSNSGLTSGLQLAVQNWQKTPWSQLSPSDAKTTAENLQGHSVKVTRSVTYSDALSAFTLTVAAPRSAMPTAHPIDCSNALTVHVDGCLTLSGTITATSDELIPKIPEGIALVTGSNQQVTGSGQNANPVLNPGFESGMTSWSSTMPLTTAVVTANPARVSGTQNLSIVASDATVSSNSAPTVPGDTWAVTAWVKSTGTTGQMTLGLASSDRAGVVTNTVAGTVPATKNPGAWQELQGTVVVPPTSSSATLTITAAGCTATCGWLVDDTSLLKTSTNLMTYGDFEATPSSWTLVNSSIVSTTNRLAPGTKALQFATTSNGVTASAISGTIAVEAGRTYQADFWTKALGTTALTGTVSLGAIWPSGASSPIESADLSGISAASWANVNLPGTITVPAGVSSMQLRISSNSKSATSGQAASFAVDDVHLTAGTLNVGGNPQSAGFVRIAIIDSNTIAAGTSIRVSYQHLGTSSADNTAVGVFCSADPTAVPVAANDFAPADGTRNWYWTRVLVPPVDRLLNCSSPELHIYSTVGAVVDSASIGTLSILTVLNGVDGTGHATKGP